MSLTTRLSALHLATTAAEVRGPSDPLLEDQRLLRENAGRRVCGLPRPVLHADLAQTLAERRTVRAFSGVALSLEQLATLLCLGVGTPQGSALPIVAGGPPGRRSYPSAGGLYPVELLVRSLDVQGLPRGVYRYQTLGHHLVAAQAPLALSATERMLADNQVHGASLLLLLWIDFTRQSLGKYGAKSYRMALLEAGHIAQNLCLLATALGAGTAGLCGFDDALLTQESGLVYPNQPVVYALAVGAVGAGQAA